MQSDRNYQQAIRGSSRPHLLDSEPKSDAPIPPCVDVIEKPNQVSIRVRLPNGSQTIIKIDSDATVSFYLFLLLFLLIFNNFLALLISIRKNSNLKKYPIVAR